MKLNSTMDEINPNFEYGFPNDINDWVGNEPR